MGFPGMGGDNSVYVDIGGSAAGATAATTEASAGFMSLADAMAAATAASVDMTAAGTGAMEGLTRSASAATEAGAAYDNLAAQSRMAAESMAQMSGAVGGSSAAGALGAAAGGGAGGEYGLTTLLGGLGGALGEAGSRMMSFISTMGAMVAGFTALGIITDMTQEVKNFTDQLVELNIQTEKNQFSWRYLYGGGNNAQGAAVAQGIADWTKKFSMQIPYTRQDLLNAVSGLAPLGLSAQGLEHYMPTIADLAATRDPNADLAQVAQVIMSASMGYTRMLKYDLKINPEDLIQYGLNAKGSGIGLHINDPSTLLPALENYAKAKGLSGAAKDISTQTWWGAWSSFMDRIQNFELDTGHDLFGSLKTNLTELSSWIDEHSAQISHFSDLLSVGLGGAFKGLAGTVGEFMSGVGESGLFQFLGLDGPPGHQQPGHASAKAGGSVTDRKNVATARIGSADKPLVPPEQLSGLQQLAKTLGEIWGNVQKIGSGQIADAWKQLTDAWSQFSKSLTPEDKQTILEVLGMIMAIPFGLVVGGIKALTAGLQLMNWWMHNMGPAILSATGHFADFLATIRDHILGAVNNAVQWGENLIGNLIKGIQNKLGDLGSVLSQAAGSIKDHLGFSSPTKVGPGSTADRWIPNLINMMVHGFQSGIPQIGAAANNAAATIAQAFSRPGSLGAGFGGAGTGVTTVVYQINAATSQDVIRIVDQMEERRRQAPNSLSRVPGGVVRLGALGGIY